MAEELSTKITKHFLLCIKLLIICNFHLSLFFFLSHPHSLQAPSSSQANGIITDYTIKYWSNSTRNSTKMEVLVGSNVTTYTLTGLNPDSEYWIQIAAHTRAGMGPFSDAVMKSTSPTGMI